jgi:hypothetical protein
MRLQVNIDSSELNNRSNKDCAENSSRPIAGSKRRGEELDLPYPPPKSRRLEFMVSVVILFVQKILLIFLFMSIGETEIPNQNGLQSK